MNKQRIVLSALRLALGFIFLWAFLDKVFGLGFSTTSDQSWIHGGSPTSGFLSMATKGPLVDIFHSLSGIVVVDWLFMLCLLFVGLTLIFNKYVKWGCIAGSLMLVLMYLSLLFPVNNPIIDDHIVYILVLVLIGLKDKEQELT
jgi:thiosulfate dehydrogenase [quinone] large subunit